MGGRGLIGDTADDKTKDCQTFEVYLDIASGEWMCSDNCFV